MDDNEEKKRRHGPQPMAPEDLRSERLSVYYTPAEHQRLAALAGAANLTGATKARRIGRYVRGQALHRKPPSVPEINRDAWAVLARVSGNLATMAVAMRGGEYVDLEEIRAALIGADLTSQEEEDESEN
jgi:hypothetical protein